MSGTGGEWKDWIIVLRVQAQDRYPPTQWAWGTAPCSADATDAQLMAALPEARCEGDLRENRAGKADHVAKGVLTVKPPPAGGGDQTRRLHHQVEIVDPMS